MSLSRIKRCACDGENAAARGWTPGMGMKSNTTHTHNRYYSCAPHQRALAECEIQKVRRLGLDMGTMDVVWALWVCCVSLTPAALFYLGVQNQQLSQILKKLVEHENKVRY